MFRGSEGKRFPGWLPRLERLMVERVLGLRTSNKHPFLSFSFKILSIFCHGCSCCSLLRQLLTDGRCINRAASGSRTQAGRWEI